MCTPRCPGKASAFGMNALTASSKADSLPARTARVITTVIGSIAFSICSLRVCSSMSLVRGSGNHIIGKLCSLRPVNHRVGVFDADTVRAEVTLDDVHHGIVGVLERPIPL